MGSKEKLGPRIKDMQNIFVVKFNLAPWNLRGKKGDMTVTRLSSMERKIQSGSSTEVPPSLPPQEFELAFDVLGYL